MSRVPIYHDIYDSGYPVHTNSSDLRFPLRVRMFSFTSGVMLPSVTLGVLHGLWRVTGGRKGLPAQVNFDSFFCLC